MKSMKFSDLYNKFYFNHIIDKTKDCVDNFSDEDTKALYGTFYYLESIIVMGKFDEAEDICYKILNNTSNIITKARTYKNLACLYYFKNELIKALLFNSKYREICDKEHSKNALEGCVRILNKFMNEAGNPTTIKRSYLIKHISNNHSHEIGENLSYPTILTKIVRDNFYQTRCYYFNFAYLRIYRCQNVGLSCNNVAFDYVAVISYDNNPDSIATIYPIPSCGDSEYFDITPEFLREKQARNAEKCNAMQKFRARQSKKKD